MKKMFVMLALAMTAVTAKAQVDADGFSPLFELNKFQIDQNSSALPQPQLISGGAIAINVQSNEVRLTIHRRFYCPPGRMCAMVMPAPLTIVLPIQKQDVTSKGRVIVAEGKDQVLEILDPNGRPSTNADDATVVKPVTVTFTETNPAINVKAVSTMTGYAVKGLNRM